MGRYLIGNPRLVQSFPWSQKKDELIAYGDSNWAGYRKDAKTTSGGAMFWSGHCNKTWSSTQQVVALSSGEAELYAMTKAATESVGILSMMRDFGMEAKAVVLSDSSAAIGIVSREGIGRTRHINVRHLWLQRKIADKEFSIKKVDGVSNVADLMTKSLAKADSDKFMVAMKMSIRGSPKMLQVAETEQLASDQWVKIRREGRGNKQDPKGDIVEKFFE